MKRSKRILALFLAVLLVGNLMVTGIPVNAATTTEKPTLTLGSGLVWSEDFESFYTEGTEITSTPLLDQSSQTADRWNGATLPTVGTWAIYNSTVTNTSKGTVYKETVVQPAPTGGRDDSVGIKVSYNEAGSRAAIMYTLGSDDYAKMIHGETYTVKYWVKMEGYEGTSDFKTIVKVTNNDYTETILNGAKNSRNAASPTLTAGEWTQCEAQFVFYKNQNDTTVGKVKSYVKIELNLQANTLSPCVLYYDDISIEGPISATAIDLPDTAEVDTADEYLELGSALTPLGASAQWTSSNESVATVDANGKVTAVGPGTTTITATSVISTYNKTAAQVEYETVTDSCLLTVTGEATNPNILFTENFDDIYDLIDSGEATLGTNALVLKADAVAGTDYWNGANHGDWAYYCNTAGAIIQPSKDGGIDGTGCVVITQNGGRASVVYQLPTEVYESMIEGVEYKVTAWIKSVGADTKPNIEIHNQNPQTYSRPAIENNTWTKVEHTDVFTTSGKGYYRFYIGQSAYGTGTYYIDNVTVERVYEAASVDLGAEETYLQTGGTLQLEPAVWPEDVFTDYVYSSSDEAVATVSESGLVTALKAGTATVTVTAVNGYVTDTMVIKVVDELVALESISLNKETLSVNPGHMEQLTVNYTPANATQRDVIWTSDKPEIVSVDENGNITVIAEGTATVTATVGTKTAACAVTAVNADGFASTEMDADVEFGHSTTVDLSTVDLSGVLPGSYTVISEPAKGMVELTGSSLKYTSYTWLMDVGNAGFTDAVYNDTVLVAVKNAEGETAVITLNVTIGKLEDLFYDENGKWITDVDLMFSQEYLDQIKLEAKNDPTGLRAELIQNVLDKADSYLYTVPNAYPCDQEDSAETSTGDITVHFLMAYLFTKDVAGKEADNAKYLEKTIEWVTASLQYPYWGTTHESHRNADRAAGHQLFSTAMVYHWLKDELADVKITDIMGTTTSGSGYDPEMNVTTENMPILDALEKRLWHVSGMLYNKGTTYNVYVMNHLHIRMSGLLAAATALRADAETDDEKALLVKWTGLALYKNGYGMNAMMPDGSNHEGVTYWAYGADWLLKTPVMAEQVYGIDMYAMTDLYNGTPEYVLYTLLNQDSWDTNSNILNFGDAYQYLSNGVTQILRILAAQYGDTTGQWLAQQLEEAGIDPQNTSIWQSALYADTSLEAISPIDGDLDTLKWYKDLDMVIARSDWSGNEDILFMKTGVPCGKNLMEMVQSGAYVGEPDAGHAHPDANHITLYSNGEYLLRDDGYACPKLTSNHNTLLVNGKGQLGAGNSTSDTAYNWMQEKEYINANAVPYMKVVESNETYGYDYIVGDATAAYPSSLGLTKYERNVVYLKDEQVMLVVDNIAAMQDTPLELRWFPGSKKMGLSGGVYTIKSDNNIMNFFPFTEESTTTWEQVTVTGRNTTAQEYTFRQKITASEWQNAVAFSWDDVDGTAATVRYLKGEGSVHQFEVNGKIYSVNVATNEVTVAAGELDIQEDPSVPKDSSITTVLLNGVGMEGFDPAVTEYVLDRYWKTYDLEVEVYTNAFGATADIQIDDPHYPTKITITCTSRDKSTQTVYTINITNSENILGIAGATNNLPRDGYYLSDTYDGVITSSDKANGGYFTVQTTTDQVNNIIVYDLGQLVTISKFDLAVNNSKNRQHFFHIEISEDGENWTRYMTDATHDPTAELKSDYNSWTRTIFENQSVTTRYVKIILRGFIQSGQEKIDIPSNWLGINELTFYGTPASVEGPGEGPSPTGDSMNMMLVALVAAMSLAAMAAFLYLANEKKNKF